jgi:hypothetical protein
MRETIRKRTMGAIMSKLEYLEFAPEICLLDLEHLHGPKEVPYGKEELLVVCVVRNGLPWIESFVEHYFSMGVKHIVFLDNDSTDDTVSAASRYADVTVLRTKLPINFYEGVGQVLMQWYLISRFGKDRWSLCVDIDELFDYPFSDVIDLSSFLGYLNSKSYTAVTAQMLDMFPERPVLERADEQDEPLKEVHRFYDISNLIRWNKEEHPRIRELLSTRNNVLEADNVEWFGGGVRTDVFGFRAHLTKNPLVFYGGNVIPNPPHHVNNARLADVTCVLFHYKFLKDFRERTMSAAANWRNSTTSDEYRKYLEVVDRDPSLRLKKGTAREITSVNDLLENAFLVASDDYVNWVNAEDRRSVLEIAHGGPDMTVEALLESRRRQRAKTVKLGRVERQLLKARQQERARAQRRSQKLNNQLRDRSERILTLEQQLRDRDQILQELNRKQERLVRQRRRLRSHNVRLEERLESMQTSRTWRLVQVLRSIKARALSIRRT